MPLPLLFLAAGGASAFSSIWQGRIADAESKQEQRLFERNALVLERDADARDRKTTFDQVRSVKEGLRNEGDLLVGLGHSGVDVGVGGAIDLLFRQAKENALNTALIGEEGQAEAARFRERAVISRFKGQLARNRGKNAKTAGLIGAGTSLLTSFGGGKSEGLF